MAMYMWLQIQWGYPQHMWWLLALPAAGLCLWGYDRWKQRQLRRLASPHLLPGLLVNHHPRRARGSALLTLAALALLSLALLSPQEPEQQGGSTLSGLEVVVALDVSNSMLAKDVSPNRLERSRIQARQLIDTLPGSKVGIVAFAGEAWLQLPLTTDLSAARMLLASLETKSVPLQGTDIAHALRLANESLPKTDLRHKAIVLFTDGEALDGDAETAARELKNSGVMLIAVGVGTPQGAIVSDADGMALRKDDGTAVVSQLDEKALREMATLTGGRYLPMQPGDATLQQILAALNSLPRQPLTNSYLINYHSYSHWLIACAAILLLASVAIRKPLHARRRPTVALAAACWLLPAIPSAAQNSPATLTQAHDLYRQGKMDQAETLYKDVVKRDPAAWNAQLHLGNIAYRRGRFEEALQQYERSLSAAKTSEAAVAILNNQGLAYVKMNKLPEAVESFKQAIRQNPWDAGLQANLGMALDELARAKRNPPPQAKPPMDPRKAENQLQALQEEEKKIRQQLMKQKQPSRQGGNKNW